MKEKIVFLIFLPFFSILSCENGLENETLKDIAIELISNDRKCYNKNIEFIGQKTCVELELIAKKHNEIDVKIHKKIGGYQVEYLNENQVILTLKMNKVDKEKFAIIGFYTPTDNKFKSEK